MNSLRNFLFCIVLTCTLVIVTKPESLARSEHVHKDSLYFANEIDKLYDQAYALIDKSDHASLDYSLRALKLAESAKDTFRIVRCGRIRALGFRRVGLMDSSLILSLKILPLARDANMMSEVGHILNGLVLYHISTSSYDKALKLAFESFEVRRQYGSASERAIALVNIGLTYFKIENYDKALVYYGHAETTIRSELDGNGIESVLLNMSLCYAYKMNLKSAKMYLDLAQKSCGKNCSSIDIRNLHFAKGLIQFSLGDLENSEEEFLLSLQMALNAKDQRFIIDNIVYLIQVRTTSKNYSGVDEIVELVETIVSEHTAYSQGLMDLYFHLSKYYEITNKPLRQRLYQEKYHSLKNSLNGYEFTRKVMNIESEFIERESQAKIAEHLSLLNLKEKVIQQHRNQNLSSALIIVLLFVLVVVLARNNKTRRLANVALESRVRDRTRELEASYGALQRSMGEQSLRSSKMSTEMKSGLSTIMGLSALAAKDLGNEDTTDCIIKIRDTAMRLSATVSRYPSFEH